MSAPEIARQLQLAIIIATIMGQLQLAMGQLPRSTQLQPYTQNFRLGTEVPFFGSPIWKKWVQKHYTLGAPTKILRPLLNAQHPPKIAIFWDTLLYIV